MLESFENALRFLKDDQDKMILNYDFREKCEHNERMIPVMIVLSVQNYNNFKYFRVNRAKYSAFPEEKEIILANRTKVFVIGAKTIV